MLIKWFWPKDMRRWVEKYRAEETLNEQALRRVEKQIGAIYTILLYIGVLFCLMDEVIVGVVILLTIPISIKIDLFQLYYMEMRYYIYGERKDVEVTRFGVSLYGTQWLDYKHLDNEIKGAKYLSYARFKKDNLPKKGDIISVFEMGNKRKRAMPDIDYLKAQYALSTVV